MATPAWSLPPLNSHQNSYLHVRIRESSQPEHFHTKRKFRIVATVDIVFYSDAAQMAFRGLSIWKLELIDVINRETLAASLRRKFLDDDELIPFPLAPCLWTEDHYDHHRHCRRRRWSPPLRLSGSDELVRKISDFVALADGRPGNKKLKLVEARLQITKLVVEAEGFAAWIAWYEEQRRVRQNFAAEYVRALTRPPQDGWCCIICLDGLDGGGVAELPCRHLFHVNCINRWLERNHVCPLCRYKLPPVHDD